MAVPLERTHYLPLFSRQNYDLPSCLLLTGDVATLRRFFAFLRDFECNRDISPVDRGGAIIFSALM